MFHRLDGVAVLLFIEFIKSPVFKHTGVHEVLVDGRELVFERTVELLN